MSKKSMKQFNERKTAQKPMQDVQPKKVKKREVEAWILAIFMIAWTVCSVLGTIGFCRTQASAESVDAVDAVSVIDEKAVECSTAYNSKRIRSNADVSTNFYSFNIDLFSSMVFFNDSLTASWFVGSWELEFNHLSATLLYRDNNGDVTFDLYDVSTEDINYYSFEASAVDGVYNTGSVEVSASNSSYSNPNREPLYVIPDLRSFYPRSYSLNPVGYDINSGATAFEVGIEFYNNDSAVSQYIYILIDTDFVESFALFYTSRGLTDTDDFGFVPIYGASFGDVDFQNGYNAGYNEGFSYGKDVGRDEGRDLGYDEGYSNGRQQGYNEGRADGFTQGVADANEYTFAGLIGAVFDAPIQAFQGLFSFDVLGVDLSGFLLSLLTCGIALCIIKLII